MIAKNLFLAENFYRYGVRFFRDHESWPAEYPGGYLHKDARLSVAAAAEHDTGALWLMLVVPRQGFAWIVKSGLPWA
jgi:hypothetical protein